MKRKKMKRRISWAALLLLGAAGAGLGEVAEPLAVPRASGPIVLNGLSDEAAWQVIPPLSFVQIEPKPGLPPSEKTELLLVHDGEFLYVAGRLFDSDPGGIRANSKQRDSGDATSDWFGVVIDSFNDKENALAFFTTPTGLRWDGAVFADAQGERPINTTWNTFWDVAVARNSLGWFAEMRIPLSSLRFQVREGRVVMGFISWRSIARKNEWAIFPAIPPNWGFWSRFKPSQAREIALDGIRPRRPFYAAPYLAGGYGRERNPGFVPVKSWKKEAGLDLKVTPTLNLTLDLTVNPDFAQIEADDAQVNLTRFSIFFPEKRLFFQERASIFDFEFERSDMNRLFYSRRIGISEGRLVRIFGGARLIGRLGGWDLGFLDMQTAAVDGLPSENNGVLRLRRRVFNPYSYVGTMLTCRLGADRRFNTAYGFDGVIRVFNNDYFSLKVAQTFASGRKNAPLSLDPTHLYINWTRQQQTGFGYGLSYSRAGEDYDPGLGFESRKDFSRLAATTWYGWMSGEKSPVYIQHLYLQGILFGRNADKTLESADLRVNWDLATKSGYLGLIGPVFSVEDLSEPFSLSNKAAVPAGRYQFVGLKFQFNTPQSDRLMALADLDAGGFYDGKRISLKAQSVWAATPDLNFDGTYEINKVRFPRRNQNWTAHIARLRALFTLSTSFSAAMFVQWSSADDAVVANVRLRYNPREGVDLYLVYNEELGNTHVQDGIFRPISTGRTVMLKYTYTFKVGG